MRIVLTRVTFGTNLTLVRTGFRN